MSLDNRSHPAERGTFSRGDEAVPDVSVLALVNLLLRHRWLLLLLPLIAAAATVGWSLSQPRKWTSTGAFAPQTSEGAQGIRGLAGMAAQFGVSVPAQNPSESPAFYAQLVRSPAVLEPLVRTRFEVPGPAGTVQRDLVELNWEGDPRSALAQETVMRRVSNWINVNRNRETGVVTVSVQTQSPELSHQITARLLELVNTFDLTRRRAQAAAEREFVEQRLAESRTELLAAEREAEQFLERNRQFRGSPELQFQYDRLQRAVQMRQDVYTTLAQSYEQSRLDEVRNLPVITVLETPRRPALPDPRGTASRMLVAMILGFIVAVVIALAHGLVRRARSGDEDDYREFLALRSQLVGELTLPIRVLGGRGRSTRTAAR